MNFISHILILTGVFISPFLFCQTTQDKAARFSDFSAPLTIPLVLSGNYGEIRSAHFHAGIDIKTEQVEGKSVLAAAQGWVFRIAVQSGGYGKALYLKHSNGLVTVYCHLKQFNPALERYVKEQQYKKKSFEVNLFPEANQFAFRKGEIIGYSGNSGSSDAPHLHFEIRDPSASVPLNVSKYNLAISDHVRPRISWLAVYPMDKSSKVNDSNQKLLIKVTGKNGNYYPVANHIRVSGKIGFGIETHDFLDNSGNACSPYAISLFINDTLQYLCILDSIPFSKTAYVNSHVDYEEKIRSGRTIQKLYLDPNNKLDIYHTGSNKGIVQFTDTAVHSIKIQVDDAYENKSVLKFKVRSVADTLVIEQETSEAADAVTFYYDSLNVFENFDVRVAVPRNALFDNIDFQFRKIPADSNILSDVYEIHNEYTPLFKSYILSIKPTYLPTGLLNKLFLAKTGENGTYEAQGGSYKNGYVTAQVRSFGKFFVAVDTLCPEILPAGFTKNIQYAEGQALTFKIKDLQSGIRKYNGYIDAKWALFEYDAKNNLLTYVVDGSKLVKGKSHTIEIIVTDNKDNVARYNAGFFY
jgi:murein DD-endopeptidase MepM/ murein hydrolase activator NlpD